MKVCKIAIGVLAFSLVSCSDWTMPRSLEINAPSPQEQNPEQYAAYLENLRSYKTSDHKEVWGWFDNSVSVPTGQADRLTALPDSLDGVILMHPAMLDAWEAEEMREIQEKKSTKVLMAVNYEQAVEQSAESAAGLREVLETLSQLCSEAGFDGISVRYDPLNLAHLDQDKDLHTTLQSAFESWVKEWTLANTEGILLVESDVPQYFGDKSILEAAQHLVIHTESAGTAAQARTMVLSALTSDVPSDRFMPLTSSSTIETVWWAAAPDAAVGVSALGIVDIKSDYFGSDTEYSFTRRAITIISGR